MLGVSRSTKRGNRLHAFDTADHIRRSDDDAQPISAQRFRLARSEQRYRAGEHARLSSEMRESATIMEEARIELILEQRGWRLIAIASKAVISDLVIPSHGCFVILISCQCLRSSKGRCLLPNRVLLRRLVNDCSPRLLHFGAADRALRPWRQHRLAADRAPGQLRSFPARSTSSMRLANANRILTKEGLLGHSLCCLFDAVLNRSIPRRHSRIQGRG